MFVNPVVLRSLRCAVLSFPAGLGGCHVFIVAITSSAILSILLIVRLHLIVEGSIGSLVLDARWRWWFRYGIELLICSEVLELVESDILISGC